MSPRVRSMHDVIVISDPSSTRSQMYLTTNMGGDSLNAFANVDTCKKVMEGAKPYVEGAED